jgi:hypothetical protein
MQFRTRPWKHDPRSKNFSHHRFFGASPLTALPNTLGRSLKWVMDQKYSQRCTGYSGAADGSHIHGRAFSGDWQAAKIGLIQGRSVDDPPFGGDPNAAMKSERDFGFLPLSDAPFSIDRDGLDGSGMSVWPKDLDAKATKFDNIPGFVRVDGPYDHFDNIRNALFMAYDPSTRTGATVRAFGRWFHDWSNTPDGIIPTTTNHFAGWHAYNFLDWCAEHADCLIAQNSYGTAAGKGGFHHFPREVVNREFATWGSSLKIVKTLTPGQIELAKQETWAGRIQRAIFDIWYALSERFGGIDQERLTFMALLVQRLGDLLHAITKQRQTPYTPPQPTPAPKPLPIPPKPHLDRLSDFCLAIRDYEGKPGELNYRNNNPGNCRCSRVGYLPIYGAVKCVNNFAVFPTYELGWLYLKNHVRSKSAAHPSWTIHQYFADPKDGHAPSSDGNDPRKYAEYVAKRLGVPVDTPLRSLLA